MRLLRVGNPGAERPAILDSRGKLRDLSVHADDIDADTLGRGVLDHLRGLDPEKLPEITGAPRIGPCVGRVGNFIAVGLNYAAHAAEANLPVPAEPVLFNKAPSSICGPHDDIVLPPDSAKCDWEIELAVVIGRPAYRIDEAEVRDCIAGYCICNDVSERAFQTERGGQWMKGKSAPTFGPLGPWLVTPDEVPDVQALGLDLRVNGRQMQQGTTSDMIFGVAFLVSYVSQFMRLLPGDVITTGTPSGIGHARRPPVYLQPGDRLELAIQGLGRQGSRVVAG